MEETSLAPCGLSKMVNRSIAVSSLSRNVRFFPFSQDLRSFMLAFFIAPPFFFFFPWSLFHLYFSFLFKPPLSALDKNCLMWAPFTVELGKETKMLFLACKALKARLDEQHYYGCVVLFFILGFVCLFFFLFREKKKKKK